MNSLYSYRFEVTRQASSRDVLMIFVATPQLDPKALATAVEAEIEINLLPDELLIVIRDTAFEGARKALDENSQNVATFARLRGRVTVTLASYGCTGSESNRAHVMGPGATRKIEFHDFQRRAVTSIFNSRQGFVESTSTYHFENPSGRHTERFIRLSNILARGAEIAFIGFCTLPFVPETASTAYLDTPSLYAVVAAINEQRSSFGIAAILADNFSSYSGVSNYQFAQPDDAIVLISASSSGSLAQQLIQDHGFVTGHVTHLLLLGADKSGSNVVCNLQKDQRLNPEGIENLPAVESATNCKLCAAGSHPVKLKGDQFEFAGPQQESLLIGKNHAPAGLAKLMERLAGGNLFAVGLGKTTSRYPRQFNVNPPALLESEAFRANFDYVLRRSLPASLSHVIAADQWSDKFADKISVALGHSASVVRRENLDSIPTGTTSAIAIAAVVIESGRTLLDISRDLRSIAPHAPLLYLVGFSKTTGEPRRDSLERTLTQSLSGKSFKDYIAF